MECTGSPGLYIHLRLLARSVNENPFPVCVPARVAGQTLEAHRADAFPNTSDDAVRWKSAAMAGNTIAAAGGTVNDFMFREVQRLGKRLFRLGLSDSFELGEAGCREALERVQYVFWSPRMKGLTIALRDALARDRERYAVSAGPLLGYFPGAVRRAAEGTLRTLAVDYVDVFQLYWLGRMSALTGAVQEELTKLREEGKVRAVGVSIHNRPRAGKLAEGSILDLLMIRYNAAHTGDLSAPFQAPPRGDRLHRHGLAQASVCSARMAGEGTHGGGLLPLLSHEPARGHRAHRAAQRGRVAREPGGAREGPAVPRRDGRPAGIRKRRPRLVPEYPFR